MGESGRQLVDNSAKGHDGTMDTHPSATNHCVIHRDESTERFEPGVRFGSNESSDADLSSEGEVSAIRLSRAEACVFFMPGSSIRTEVK